MRPAISRLLADRYCGDRKKKRDARVRKTGSGAIGRRVQASCEKLGFDRKQKEMERWMLGTGRKRGERRRQWELKRAVGSISGKFRALCFFGPDTAVSIPASVKLPALEKEERRLGGITLRDLAAAKFPKRRHVEERWVLKNSLFFRVDLTSFAWG